MNDKIEITCPRCQHKWRKYLHELEREQILYRGGREKSNGEVVTYRAACPFDGTHVVIEVMED